MKHTFTCNIHTYDVINALPDTWSPEDYRGLLTLLDFDEADSVVDEELSDMTCMAMNDLEPLEAAERVLTARMSTVLNPGQIKNCSQELREEPLWEEYPEPAAHRLLFVCQDLLSRAFPGLFSVPEAVALTIEIVNTAGVKIESPVPRELILKILAQGMDDHAILTRMYDEKLAASGPFREADWIVWDSETEKVDGPRATVSLVSSVYWMRGLPDEGSFDATVAAAAKEDD